MKKVILSISMAIMSTVAFGQIESGTMFLGGSLGFSSGSSETSIAGTTVDGPETSSFNLAPSFGYMFTDQIGAGLRVGINNNTTTQTGTNQVGEFTQEDKTSITMIGAFGRYYLPVAGDKWFGHVDLGFDIGFGSNTSTFEQAGTTVETETDINMLGIGLRPGFDYFVGDKWALELNWGFLGYNSTTVTTPASVGNPEEERVETGFGADFDFTQFGVGARWYF